MAGKIPIVMISSTFRDLNEHRKGVMDACLRQDMFPRMMEHLPATDDDGLAESLRLVDEADVYLGIIAHRYGCIPKGKTKSITHYEYERATARGIHRLIFIMHDEHPTRLADVDKGDSASKLDQFKTKLKAEHSVNFFTSPADLQAQVIDSLAKVKKNLQRRD